MPEISKAKVVILATHGFEQSELQVPLERLRHAGAEVVVVSPEKGQIRGWKDKDWGESVNVDKVLGEVSADDYDAIVLPGGQINPDLLRINAEALQLIRDFLDSGKVVAAICHAPWLLIEVDAVRGRQVTSYKSIKTDMVNAGGKMDRSRSRHRRRPHHEPQPRRPRSVLREDRRRDRRRQPRTATQRASEGRAAAGESLIRSCRVLDRVIGVPYVNGADT